jgi:hypothetical protein
MKKVLCLIAALTLALSSLGCTKIQARMEIKAANEAYQKEDWSTALSHYQKARQIDPSFPDLDRLVGYSEIGLYIPDDKSAKNEAHAGAAISALNAYLKKRPEDRIARDALINMYLNANRTTLAIDYFINYLQSHPADLEAVKSIATLYAKQGDFNKSLDWYQKITLLDSKNPESFYIFGVVCYEKVAKNMSTADPAQKMDIINRGKDALQHAIDMKPDYTEAMVYLNLLWRQQAVVDALTDPVKAQADVAVAEAILSKRLQLINAKKAATAKKS